jgi:PQQ-like domain
MRSPEIVRSGERGMTAYKHLVRRKPAMKRVTAATIACLVMLPCLAFAPFAATAQSVVTYHNAPDRSGLYTVPGLTVAAAANLHLDPGFNATVSGNVYAQPLYWQPPGAKTGLLIVATESNLVYGLNANTGAQVWKTQLTAPPPHSALGCGNIDPEGITGTPVIDPATGTLYLDALTLQAGAARHKIYALSAATGKVIAHWPLDVESLMSARHAAFDSSIEGERSALQFFDGKLYVNYAGRFGDCGDYHGIVIEFDPTKLTVAGSWETRATGGGIWAQGGLASDGTSLYATTGNTIGASSWQDGEAVIRLRPGLARSRNTKDYFTPYRWHTLDNEDLDLGGSEALPFTVPTSSSPVPRVLALGKDGYAYLLNAANLGGVGHAIQNLQVSNSVIITEPTIYETKTDTLVAFTNFNGSPADCSGNNLTMLKVTAGVNGALSVAWCAALSGGGAPILTTTNGIGSPIEWVLGAQGDNQLHGFNALNGKTVFGGGGVTMNGLHNFGTLIAANKHLYIAGDGTLYAFTF